MMYNSPSTTVHSQAGVNESAPSLATPCFQGLARFNKAGLQVMSV